MSYNTTFEGKFKCTPKCNQSQINFINNINNFNIKNYNIPNDKCCWIINNTGEYLQWNNDKSSIYYDDWIIYLLKSFFIPNNILLNGIIKWYGDDHFDIGKIIINNNCIDIFDAKITFVRNINSDEESEYFSDDSYNNSSENNISVNSSDNKNYKYEFSEYTYSDSDTSFEYNNNNNIYCEYYSDSDE